MNMRRQFEEFRKQQQRQTEFKEKSQKKPTKVPFKKNSKSNEVSRSEKWVGEIVRNEDGLNCIDLDLLIIFLSGSTTYISWNKIKNIVSFRENELKTDTIIKLDHFLCEFTPPDT